VLETDRDRALMIADGLRQGDALDIVVIGEEAGLARSVAERNRDHVLIDAGNPSRDVLEEFTLATAPMQRPVAMFVAKSDAAMTKAAIEAGMSAQVVDGLRAERLKPILDAAIARFHMVHKMRVELAETRRALEERKVIDAAKSILMRARGIGEEEAYGLLRKTAMDQAKKVVDLAQAFALIGDTLYVANTDAIVAFPDVAGATSIEATGNTIALLPAGPVNHHWTKDLLASRDGMGNSYTRRLGQTAMWPRMACPPKKTVPPSIVGGGERARRNRQGSGAGLHDPGARWRVLWLALK